MEEGFLRKANSDTGHFFGLLQNNGLIEIKTFYQKVVYVCFSFSFFLFFLFFYIFFSSLLNPLICSLLTSLFQSQGALRPRGAHKWYPICGSEEDWRSPLQPCESITVVRPFLPCSELGVANIYSPSELTWVLSDGMFLLSDCE